MNEPQVHALSEFTVEIERGKVKHARAAVWAKAWRDVEEEMLRRGADSASLRTALAEAERELEAERAKVDDRIARCDEHRKLHEEDRYRAIEARDAALSRLTAAEAALGERTKERDRAIAARETAAIHLRGAQVRLDDMEHGANCCDTELEGGEVGCDCGHAALEEWLLAGVRAVAAAEGAALARVDAKEGE